MSSVPATLPIDAGYLLILGAVFGLAAPAPQRKPTRRAWLAAMAGLALLGVGAPVAFYVLWPDWMWGYFVDPTQVPAWLPAALFAAYVSVYLAAYVATVRCGRRGWLVLALGVVVQAVLIALTWDRYRRTGEFTARPGPSNGVMSAAAGAIVCAGIGLLAFARRRPE